MPGPEYLGLANELKAFVGIWYPHEGNSHKEKYTLWGVVASVVLMLFLRSAGLISFEDPHVETFVTFGIDVMKMLAGAAVGYTFRGEREYRKKQMT